MMKKWDKSKIIEELKRIKEKEGRINARFLLKKYPPLLYAMRDIFGSWATAVEAAGFSPAAESLRKLDHETWSKDKIIEKLKELKAKEGKINTATILAKMPPLYSAMKKYFGNWEKAVTAAGFSPAQERVEKRFKFWSKEKIIKKLREIKKKEKNISTPYLHKKHSALHWAIYKYFGTWRAAVTAAGFKVEKESIRNIPKLWDRKKVISQLTKILEDLKKLKTKKFSDKEFLRLRAEFQTFYREAKRVLKAGF